MNYLFFDIECASVFKDRAKICAFGYCLTDEQFNIIKKEDILINPQGEFHLTDKKGKQGIVLPYEYKEFKKYPTFPQQAEKIYSLLEDKNTIVAGHATMNDVRYLNLESKRFSLPSFCFDFADTQFIYMNKIESFNRQFGLGIIADALGVEFIPHRAADDAYATMRIAKAMCAEENLNFSQLLNKYKIRMGHIENYEISQNTSENFEKYCKELVRKKEQRNIARIQFHDFVDKEKRKRSKNGALRNKIISFSHSIELDSDAGKNLIKFIFKRGGIYSFRAEDCDIYVCRDGDSAIRINNAKANKARIYTEEEFIELNK